MTAKGEDRLGSFLIAVNIAIEPHVDKILASQFEVIRAHKLDFPAAVEITAYCDRFRRISSGERCPKYDVSMKKDGNVRIREIGKRGEYI